MERNHQQEQRSMEPDREQDELADNEVPKPVYSRVYGKMDLNEGGLDAQAAVTADGRVNININENTPRLLSIFKPPSIKPFSKPAAPHPPLPPSLHREGDERIPPLNIVIHVVGSRGDVQPFVALGQVLKRVLGHRVRLATHPTFRQFVEENGLEFFSIGGDPAELMAFMVKNPGLMPGIDAIKNGDIRRRRMEIATILSGCWRSCFEAGDGTGVPASDATADLHHFPETSPPFVADAIIANPPSFAHVHCAERLGIPLHLMFTMPWSPTQAFPHPLASIQASNADLAITNYVSYAVVEMMTWQGLGDIINRFREKSLGLEAISIMWAPAMIPRMRIPFAYCWSPALIPKPNDWGSHIDIPGFYFLSLGSNYTPSEDLAAFLAAGPPPVYIGFGSIVVDDPNEMTRLIFEAVRLTGQRALVSKGWGGLGVHELGIPEGVFMLGNCPHDWLFKHVSCVVHHGGAGTTAAGIALGRPTMIVPFFGDQPFWGAMISKAGAGPDPVPYKQLTAEKLAAGILQALQPTTLANATELGERIRGENGVDAGSSSFHQQLNIDRMRCAMTPGRVAVFRVKRTHIRLSAVAFAVLNAEGVLDPEDVKLYRPKEYITEPDPPEPVIGGGAAMLGNIGELIMGFADVSLDIKRGLNTTTRARSRSGSLSTRQNSPSQTGTSTSSNSEQRSLSPAPNPVGSLVTQSTNEDGKPEQGSDSVSVNSTEIDSKLEPEQRSTESSQGKANSHIKRETPAPENQTADTSRVSAKFDLESVMIARKTAAKVFNMGLKVPTDFTLAVAKGFHNAPLLYGDDTVREPAKITGIKSGFKAAGREFGYGFYDGISGLATHPIIGAKKEGTAGAIKGFSKGIGGLILKPAAGVWALTGYTMSGVYKEIQKRFGESVENYIMASRCAQGLADLSQCTKEEKEQILQNWTTVQDEFLKRKRRPSGSKPHDLDRSDIVRDGGKFGKAAAKGKSEAERAVERANHRQAFQELFRGLDFPTLRRPRRSTLPSEYEDAIQHSVHVTSQGDAVEDEMIERALRASMVELRSAEAAGEEEQHAYDRAIDASIREAGLVLKEKRTEQEQAGRKSDGSESLNKSRPPPLPPRNIVPILPDEVGDEDLEIALAESRRMHEDDLKREQRESSEMDVVMKYVTRQSLAEFEHERQQRDPSLLPPNLELPVHRQSPADDHEHHE